MILSHILAMSSNRVIGRENGLPWHIPEDLRFFMKKTTGHILIMGRKTFLSLKKPLPNRLHIVLSRQPLQKFFDDEGATAQVMAAVDLAEALDVATSLVPQYGEEVFICGGGEIYRQTLPVTQRIHLTLVDQEFEGDTTYPEISTEDFRMVNEVVPKSALPIRFQTFERCKPLNLPLKSRFLSK